MIFFMYFYEKKIKMSNLCNELDKIQFGIYSAEEIQKMSVCDVFSTKLNGPNSVYDKRMGVLEMKEICPTCNKTSKDCIGHFGSIQLNINVLHPLFSRLIISLLKCICYKCSGLLLNREKLELLNLLKLQKSSRFNAIVKAMDKIDICSSCQTCQPKYIFATMDRQIYMIFKIDGENTRIQMFENEIYKIFSNMKEDDIELMGLNKENFHPKNLIISVLPVLPPVSRPYVMADTVVCDDDLTLQYVEIIKANNHISKNTTSDFKKQKYIQIIKFRIRSLFDNSGEKQKVSNGRPLKGIKKRLTGKEGIIRNNLMGKRVDKSARSVIGPDPTLKIDEIAIPHEIASTLSYPIRVNNINKEEMNKLLENDRINYVVRDEMRINVRYASTKLGTKISYGDIIFKKNGDMHVVTKESNVFQLSPDDTIFRNGKKIENVISNKKRDFQIKIGDIVERQLQDGDIVLLNRQPTLHRGSMIAMKVKIYPGKTIRLNLAVTSTFNADFDGDEMNLFSPNNLESEVELRYLSGVDNFILNPQSSKANIVFVQDCVLGIYKLTHSDRKPFTRNEFFQIAQAIDDNIYEILQEKKKYFKDWTGKFLFSLLLPRDFFYSIENNVDTKEPILCIEHGILKKGTVQKKNLNKIIEMLYIEYDVDTCKKFINQTQFLAIKYLECDSFSVGIKDCILHNDNIQYSIEKSLMKAKSVHETIQNEKIKEIYTRHSLGGARDIGLAIAKDSLKNDNNFLSTVISGAKGDFFNIAQITGLLGQQQVCTGRIQNSLTNCSRVLPHYPIHEKDYNDNMKYEAKGFIRGCFGKGLSPREFFLHSITGREGITDTAMKSVVYDTKILLYSAKTRKEQIVSIGAWIDSLLKVNYQNKQIIQDVVNKENMELCSIENDCFYILTTDANGFVQWSLITDVTRHDPTKIMYEIETESGRRLSCTDCKSLLSYNAITHQLEEVSPTKLQINDYLPVTRNFLDTKSTTDFEELETTLKCSSEDLESDDFFSRSDIDLSVIANQKEQLYQLEKLLQSKITIQRDNEIDFVGSESLILRVLNFLNTFGIVGDLSYSSKKCKYTVPSQKLFDFAASKNGSMNLVKKFKLDKPTINNIYLDKIKMIKKIHGFTEKVYDITVPATLNFCLANGLHIRDTATSGYIQRRMIKIAEDIHIAEDLTVRNVNNNIIQFSYGNNFLNPSICQIKNNNLTPISIERLITKLNYNHETKKHSRSLKT